MSRHCGRSIRLIAIENGKHQLQRLSLSTGDHPAGDLAVSPLHAELPRRRGSAGRARDCRILRDGATLGEPFRSQDCSRTPQTPAKASHNVALGRSLPQDRRSSGLSMASRGLRRRGPGRAGSGEEKQAIGAEIDAQVAQEIRIHTGAADHGRPAFVWSCSSGSWHLGSPSTRSLAQQSRGEFASADTTTRAKDAGVQEPGFSPEISLRSCRHLQHVQCSTPSHFSEDPPSFSLFGDGDAVRGRRGCEIEIVNRCCRVDRSTT